MASFKGGSTGEQTDRIFFPTLSLTLSPSFSMLITNVYSAAGLLHYRFLYMRPRLTEYMGSRSYSTNLTEFDSKHVRYLYRLRLRSYYCENFRLR